MRLNIFGDFVASGRIGEIVKGDNYKKIIEGIYERLKISDYNIVNLESPILEKGSAIDKLGPNLKSPPEIVKLLKYGRFNVATLANNHIMDFGAEGLSKTYYFLQSKKIESVGAGKNLEEASKPLILEKYGIKVGIINIAEHEFSIATEENSGANPLNPIQNHYQIKELRGKVDQIVVVVHGGHEHYEYPSPRMQDAYRFFIDSGADLVIGHHPHCFSGYESYNEGLIFYSLGNFIFDKEGVINNKWNYGYGLSLKVAKENMNFELIPYNQFSKDPIVSELQGKELKVFKENLKDINSVINDREKLLSEFEKYCERRMGGLKTLFEPYENRILKALKDRNLLPSLISRKKYLRLYNYLLCQAHRDLVEFRLEAERDKIDAVLND